MNKLSIVIILAVFVSVIVVSVGVGHSDLGGPGDSCISHSSCGSGCCLPTASGGKCADQSACNQYYTCKKTSGQECKESCTTGYVSGDGTCQFGVCCKQQTTCLSQSGTCKASCTQGTETEISGTECSGTKPKCCKSGSVTYNCENVAKQRCEPGTTCPAGKQKVLGYTCPADYLCCKTQASNGNRFTIDDCPHSEWAFVDRTKLTPPIYVGRMDEEAWKKEGGKYAIAGSWVLSDDWYSGICATTGGETYNYERIVQEGSETIKYDTCIDEKHVMDYYIWACGGGCYDTTYNYTFECGMGWVCRDLLEGGNNMGRCVECTKGGQICSSHEECCSHYEENNPDNLGYGNACQNWPNDNTGSKLCCVLSDKETETCTADSQCCWSAALSSGGGDNYCTNNHCCKTGQIWNQTEKKCVCVPGMANGIKCINNMRVPVCGGTPDPSTHRLSLTMDNCAQSSPWGRDDGVPKNLIICTSNDNAVNKDRLCNDTSLYATENDRIIDINEPDETITEGDVTYKILYCKDPCMGGCEAKGSFSKTCLNRKYNKDDRIASNNAGEYATTTYGVFNETPRCIDWRYRTTNTSGPTTTKSWEFTPQKVSIVGPSLGFSRANDTNVFCIRGCSSGACKANTAPVLTSIDAKPKLVKIGDMINITSIGSDRDTITDEATGNSMREPVRLACSSQSSGDDINGSCYPDPDTGEMICPDGTTTTKTFTPDICISKFALTNPNCAITANWNDNGNKTIYCRLIDKGGNYSAEKSVSIAVDNTGPHVEIRSPAANSRQIQDFTVVVNDTDENGITNCSYSVWSNNVLRVENKQRTCNSGFVVTVGKDKNCTIGTCTVRVIGVDRAGNSASDTRNFIVNYIFSNITSPASGAWQPRDFFVYVQDTDYSGVGLDKCFYRIMNSTSETRAWTERICNQRINITVGADNDCNEEGGAKCFVYIKANNTDGAEGVSSYAFYNISWSIPQSTITSPESDVWQKQNFNAAVHDEEFLDKGFRLCEYMIKSNGITTKPWTTRLCNSNIAVTVGNSTGNYCRDEGAGSCTVFVRATSNTGIAGNVGNRSFSILLSDVNPDGFSSVTYTKTDTGVKFEGVPRVALFAPLLRVCNDGTSVNDCRNAYTTMSNVCGLNKPCLCGAFNKYDCEFVCGDYKGQFYLLATGMSGLSETAIMSTVKNFDCPVMNLTELNGIYNYFKWLNETFSVQIYFFDYLIRSTNDTSLIEQYTSMRNKYRDARMLVIEHLIYMADVIADPSVTKSQQAFAKTTAVINKIREILSSGYTPTDLDIIASIPAVVSFNAEIDMPILISKTGGLELYANMACDIKKPSGIKLNSTTACLEFATTTTRTHHVIFNSSELGQWNINCSVYGSVRSDCKRGIRYDEMSSLFDVYPPYDLNITNAVAPADALNGSSANVLVTAHNYNDYDYYGRAQCTFKNPAQTEYRVNSTCMQISMMADRTFTVAKIVDKQGTWTIPSCSIYASSSSDCAFPSLRNVSNVNAAFDITLPDYVYISAVNAPSRDVMNNTNINIGVVVNNPIADRFILVDYVIGKPDGADITNTSACTGLQSGESKTFNFGLLANMVGAWNIEKVAVSASASGDCSGSVLQHNVTGPSFNVVRNMNLTIMSVTPLTDIMINTTKILNIAVNNPFTVDKYGYVRCVFRDPANSPFSNTSSCRLLTRNIETTTSLGVTGTRPGTWIIDSCTVYGSMNSNCLPAAMHHVLTNVGSFNVMPTAEPYINTTQLSASTISIGQTISAVLNAINPSTENKYVKASCTFRSPDNANNYYSSSCMSMPAGSDATITVSANPSTAGTWTVPACSLNVSAQSDCAQSSTKSTKTNIGSFTVTMPNTLYISSITVPSGVANDTDVAINVATFNPLSDMYVRVRCNIKKPDLTATELQSICTGVPVNTARTFHLNTHVSDIGTWNITRCFVEGSTQSNCANAAQYYNTAGPTFDVTQGANLTIMSVTPLTDIMINTTKMLNINLRNPSAIDKYARITCGLRKPNLQTISNTTTCGLVLANSVAAFNLGFYANLQGTWDIVSCSAYGSMDNCASTTLQHTLTNIGSYNVYSTSDPFINSTQLSASSVVIGGTIGVIVNVTNPDTAEKYAKVHCRFDSPDGSSKYGTSACTYVPGNGLATLTASASPDKTGTWTVPLCSLNVSMQSTCASPSSVGQKANIGSFTVTMPNTLYITAINIPADVVNDTDTTINVATFNPMSDMYGRVRCTVKKPDASSLEYISNCSGIPSNTSRTFQISLHPANVGIWNINYCSIEGGSQSNCANAVQHYNTTGPSFNVVQGSSLTILSSSFPPTLRINTTNAISLNIRNPSAVDRYGRATCSIRKPNTQVFTNTSSCVRIPASTTQTIGVNAYADLAGTWDVLSCYVSGSLNSDCSSSAVHHTISNLGSYDVFTELNLTITGSRLVYDTIFLDNNIIVMIDTRNPDNENKYATVSCEFKAPNNISYYNVSACEYMEREHDRTFELDYLANISGTWYIRNCMLNASTNIACSSPKIHAKKDDAGIVYVRAPDLRIMYVVAPQASLNVGDTAEIRVDVKNFASSNRTAYVNCSLKDPSNRTYALVTPAVVIMPGATETFLPSMRVGVPGTWTVLSCAVYKIMSPATKEYEIALGRLFNVNPASSRECAISNDCPGTNEKCYCSSNACMPCSLGKTCQNHECIQTPAPECVTSNDCPPGHECSGDKCVRRGDCTYDAHCDVGYTCANFNCVKKGECVIDADCKSGYECRNYSCQTKESPSWISQNLILFIIIVFIILLIPILLFTYARRSI